MLPVWIRIPKGLGTFFAAGGIRTKGNDTTTRKVDGFVTYGRGEIIDHRHQSSRLP
jgi:hypothetical protein